MTIDDGAMPPDFVRREPRGNGDVRVREFPEPTDEPRDLVAFKGLLTIEQLQDPLMQIAMAFSALPAKELWKMCDKMLRPDMDKVLVEWALSYMEERDFKEPAKTGRL